MARPWKCVACHASNGPEAVGCENCGVAKPEPKRRESREAAKPRHCEVDGGTLDSKGFCSVGQGYVSAAPCPFACPFCRHLLTWDGRCFTCYGCTTGRREDWTIPGDRYETDGGHWRLVEKGPQAVCTPEQNREAIKVVIAVLDKRLTVAEGHEMLELLGIPDTRGRR
jgi:hypothetical protein